MIAKLSDSEGGGSGLEAPQASQLVHGGALVGGSWGKVAEKL